MCSWYLMAAKIQNYMMSTIMDSQNLQNTLKIYKIYRYGRSQLLFLGNYFCNFATSIYQVNIDVNQQTAVFVDKRQKTVGFIDKHQRIAPFHAKLALQ